MDSVPVKRNTFFPESPAGFLIPAAPCCVNVLEIALMTAPVQHFYHCRVDTLRAQTAAKGENQRTRVHSQLPTRLFLAYVQKIITDRVAGNNHLTALRQIFSRRLISNQNCRGIFCEHFHRHARKRIGLMHYHGDSHARRLPEHRTADVAAGTDRDIRTEIFENTRRFHPCGNCMCRRRQIPSNIFYRQSALKAPHIHRLNAKSRSRHQFRLHSPFRAYKQNLRIRVLPADAGSNGQRRIDMPRGAASCHQNAHRTFTPFHRSSVASPRSMSFPH